MVSVQTVPQLEKPNRRLHSILPLGEAELDRWLSAPLQQVPIREPFLLRIFLGGRLGPVVILKVLRDRIDEANEMVATLTAIKATFPNDSFANLHTRLYRATLENGLAHATAEIEWASSLIQEVQTEFGNE